MDDRGRIDTRFFGHNPSANRTIQITRGPLFPPSTIQLGLALACVVIGVTTFCLIMGQAFNLS